MVDTSKHPKGHHVRGIFKHPGTSDTPIVINQLETICVITMATPLNSSSEPSVPIYILHSELPDQRGKLTGLNLCKIIDDIAPNEPLASQLHNGVWTIWLKSREAQQKLSQIKHIEIDNIRIELFDTFPCAKPIENEKIIFKDLPFWINDRDILLFLSSQVGIVAKTGVISARLRDENNQLTKYFSGDRFVYVRGNMSRIIHNTALINFCTCRVLHRSQDTGCRRCRHVGHVSTDVEHCKAYAENTDIITIRSPNYVLCNYYV